MRFWLNKIGDAPEEFFVMDIDFPIAQERERSAFVRSHGDVKLTLSDMSKTYANKFLVAPPATRWEIRIDGDIRKLFRGEIDNESIDLDFDNNIVTFTAFAKTKIFWEWAKSTLINQEFLRPFSGQLSYTYPYTIPLETVLQYNLLKQYWNTVPDGFPESLTVDTTFSLSELRSVYDDIGNWESKSGRYVDLKPTTTVADLLTAFQVHYNAEFYIDEETNALVMQPRRKIINDAKTEISALIASGTEKDGNGKSPHILTVEDENKYDYIKAFLPLVFPEAPTLNDIDINYHTYTDQGNWNKACEEAGCVGFRLSAIVTDGTRYFETPLSDTLDTSVNLTNIKAASAIFTIDIKALKVPAGYTVNNLLLYRTNLNNPGVGWKCFSGNNSYTNTAQTITVYIYLDYHQFSYQGSNQATDPSQITLMQNAYYRYDETAGTWDSTTIEPVKAKIFDTSPSLEFVDNANSPDNYTTRTDQSRELYHFFCEDNSFEDLQIRWFDLVRTRRKLTCWLKGTNYKLGDSIVYSDLPAGTPKDYVIVKLDIWALSEWTEIKAVSI